MHQALTIAIATGLAAMLSWGFADFLAKKTVDETGDIRTLFWAQFFGIIPLIVYYLFFHTQANLDAVNVIFLFLFGVSDAIGYLLFYRALEKGKVSIISPIFASYAAFSVLISAFIFGEAISFARWAVLGIVFIGIMLSSFNIRDFSWRREKMIKGLPEVLIAVIIFSFWFPFWDKFLSYGNWLVFVLIARVIATATIFFFSRKIKLTLHIKKKGLWSWLILIGIFDVMATLFLSFGFKETSLTSVVVMLSTAYSLPTIILARIFLKEKTALSQFIGVAAIIAGLVLLSATG